MNAPTTEPVSALPVSALSGSALETSALQTSALPVAVRELETDRHYFDHALELNRRFSEQIGTADQKAAYIFTFLIALLVSSTEARTAFSWRHYRTGLGVEQVLSLVFAVALGVSLFAAVAAVLPRKAAGRSVMFWGAWPQARERLAEARRTAPPDFLYGEYLNNAATLAEICRRKYQCVNLGFRALLVLVVAYVALLGVGAA